MRAHPSIPTGPELRLVPGTLGAERADAARRSPSISPGAAAALARDLVERHGALDGPALLERVIGDVFRGRIALVSSFGTESAVLLDMVAAVDRATPVLFLDTGMLFPETLRYRDLLVERLGLTDVRSLRPDDAALRRDDPDAQLWWFDPDRCCGLRKVAPLGHALAGFDAWITGRKQFQGGEREALPAIEAGPDGRIKVNPLARWTRADLEARFVARGLPPHPLEAEGYRSLGCGPCTTRSAPGEDPRAGRWRGRAKAECGIHLPPPAALPDAAD